MWPSSPAITSCAASLRRQHARMQAVLAAAPNKIVLLGVRPDRPDPGGV
jgi:hypothetical protein